MTTAMPELSQEQGEALQLAIQHIIPYCTDDADQEVLRHFSAGLAAGDELTGELLDGATNYSFAVRLKGNKTTGMFVKVAKSFARWNPEGTFAVERLTIEYEMLERFTRLLGQSAPVATPYFCVDLQPQARMMAVELAPSHEPWAEQFTRGNVDDRIVQKAARFLAIVNSQLPEERDYNDGIKESFRDLFRLTRRTGEEILATDNEPANHYEARVKELGPRFGEIVDGLATSFEKQEVFLHGDVHAFNVMVECVADSGDFGEKGEFYVCDWEFSHFGSKGRDTGSFRAWPIASAYFLAVRGEKEKAFAVIDAMERFWDIYVECLLEQKPRSEEYILELYRSTLSFCGFYAYSANVLLKVHHSGMPFHLVSEQEGKEVLACLAYTGLYCIEYGCPCTEPTLTLPALRTWFKDLVESQLHRLLAMRC